MVSEILEQVKIIRGKKEKRVADCDIQSDHKEFFETYPKLFQMAMESTFDMDMFKFILACKEQLTENNANDIDEKVMNTLKKKYIDPLVGPGSNI